MNPTQKQFSLTGVSLKKEFSISLLLALGVLALTGGTSGCRSIICRTTDPGLGNYEAYIHGGKFVYPGVVSDIKLISAPWAKGIRDDPQGGAAFIGIPYGVMDLPFSLALDSALLPVDLLMVTVGGRKRDGTPARPQPKGANPPSASDAGP